MVLQQKDLTINVIQDPTETWARGTDLLQSFETSVDLQSKKSIIASQNWLAMLGCKHLLKRIAFLKEVGGNSPQPDIKLVWQEGFESSLLQTDAKEGLWQEILVKFGSCEAPAKIAARHFDRIIQVGMNANAVPFPCKLARHAIGNASDWAGHSRPWRPVGKNQFSRRPQQSPGTDPCMHIQSRACNASESRQDVVAFPFFSQIVMQWTDQGEKEMLDMLLAGRAKDPHCLRQGFNSKPPLDMELVPWPTLQDGTVASDVCTDAQAKVSALRQQFPLSLQRLEKRRAVLAKKLGCELNRRVFEECMPEQERDAAFSELQASRTRDKAIESARYEELAAQGASFVVWPVPHERRWPAQSTAWKNRCRWFAMWRSQPAVASEFAYKPLKRSSSLSSIGSWAAVSDISWMEIESQASECGWQEILNEQIPALTSAKPTDIPKSDLVEIKSFQKPPRGVCLTMEVMCVLLQVPPTKLKDGGLDYWPASRDLLAQVDFLARLNALVEYLPASALDAVSPYMSLEDFTPEVIGISSLACKALCAWARELYKYHTLLQASAEVAWQEYAKKPTSDLLSESQEAIGGLPKAALQELKSLGKPPTEVVVMCSCFLHLFAGIAPEVELTKKGHVKDASWSAFQKFMSNPEATLKRLLGFKEDIDAGKVPAKNMRNVLKVLRENGHVLNPEAMINKSIAASHLCTWLMSTAAYYEHSAPTQQEVQCTQASSSSMQASKCLCKADIVEIKCLASPPQQVMIVCVCACILLGKDASTGWAGAKEMVADVRFLKTLVEHKKEDVTAEQVAKVREILEKDECFEGERIKFVSMAAYGLLQWVLLMIKDE